MVMPEFLKNSKFQYNNAIGNKNDDNTLVPSIKNKVDFGVNLCVFGKVKISNNTKIGATVIVNKTFLSGNAVLIGLPIKINGKINIKRIKEWEGKWAYLLRVFVYIQWSLKLAILCNI